MSTLTPSQRHYSIRRRILIQAMGGVCEYCGSTEDLEFHHLEERTWVAAKTSRWQRQKKYEEEWDAGLLKLACADCNKRLGCPGRPSQESTDDVPF